MTSVLWEQPSRFDLSIDNAFVRSGYSKLDFAGRPFSKVGLDWLNRVYYRSAGVGRVYVKGSVAFAGDIHPGRIYRLASQSYLAYLKSNLAGGHAFFFEDMSEGQAASLMHLIERSIGGGAQASTPWGSLLARAYAGENEFCSSREPSHVARNSALADLHQAAACGVRAWNVLSPVSRGGFGYESLHPSDVLEKISREVVTLARVFSNFAGAFGESRSQVLSEARHQVFCAVVKDIGVDASLASLYAGSGPLFNSALARASSRVNSPSKVNAKLLENAARGAEPSAQLKRWVAVQTELARLEEREAALSLKRAHAYLNGVKNAAAEFPFLRAGDAKPDELTRSLVRMNEGADMIRSRFALSPDQAKALAADDREIELLKQNAYSWTSTEMIERTRRVHKSLVALIEEVQWGQSPAKLNAPAGGWLAANELERFQQILHMRAGALSEVARLPAATTETGVGACPVSF